MKATVLVAEDELLIAMDVMDELDEAGFLTIGPFAKTTEALEYCQRKAPDCAVLDVRLADGDSFPIADWLAAHDIPVVFHSGHAPQTLLEDRYPRVRVCPKPSGFAQISGLVAELCRRKRG